MEKMKTRKQSARASFENFVATVIENNARFFIIDWRDRNGSGYYAVRYILDIEKGNFIVTGDLGNSIASWFNKVTPGKLRIHLNDIGYYISKLQTSSDIYTYEQSDVVEDLTDMKNEVISEISDLSPEEIDGINEDFKRMEELLEEMDLSTDRNYPDELTDLFAKYDQDWWESTFANLGCRISQRVILWSIGFQMAYDQVFKSLTDWAK